MRLIDADALKLPHEELNSRFAVACAPTIAAVPVDDLWEKINEAHNEGYDVGYWAGRRDYEQKWIPVTDRLPEECGWYIAYVFAPGIQWGDITTKDSAWVQPVFFYDGKFHKLTSQDVGVTHWMTLPEPPKEET